MPLTTTQIAYPPIQSQATEDFIATNVAAADRHGSMIDDFKRALATVLAVDPNDYSIDDLWALYILGPIATDANASPGNSAAARAKNVGQHPRHYYPWSFLRNSGNANKFPTGSNPIEYYINTTYDFSDPVASGTTYETPTNSVSFPQSALVDGDDYLVYHRAHVSTPSNTSTLKLLAGSATLGGVSFQRADSNNFPTSNPGGKGFGVASWFTADTDGAPVHLEMYGGSSADCYVKRHQTLMMNLTTDMPNHVKDRSSTVTTITSAQGTVLTDTSVVLPPGDYLLFYFYQYAGWSFTYANLQFGLDISGTNHIVAGRVNPSAQYHADNGMMLLKNYAGGTVTATGINSGGGTCQLYGKAIVALNMKDFKEWYGNQSLVNSPTTMTAARYADETIDTLTVPSITNSGDFLNLAWMSRDETGTDFTIGVQATTDVNSAGDTIVAFNNDYQDTADLTSLGDPTVAVISDEISTYAAGDSVTQKLVIASDYVTPSVKEYNFPGQALVMMEKADARTPVTQVPMNNLADYTINADTVLNWATGTAHDDGIYNTGFLDQYGERFYATGNVSNEARIYWLSTAWDPSSYVYVGHQSTHGSVPCGYWEDEATGRYHAVADWSNGDIDFYSNANGFTPTDATRTLIGTWTPPESTEAFHVSRDGVYIYTYNKVGSGNHRFKNFEMSTPWDPSTATLIGQYTPSQTTGARIWVAKDGTDILTSNLNNSTLEHHRMSTAHDLTTTTLVSTMTSPTAATSTHLWMSDDAERLYLSKHNTTGDMDMWIRTYSGSTIDPT